MEIDDDDDESARRWGSRASDSRRFWRSAAADWFRSVAMRVSLGNVTASQPALFHEP
jgi:hypothetical protein